MKAKITKVYDALPQDLIHRYNSHDELLEAAKAAFKDLEDLNVHVDCGYAETPSLKVLEQLFRAIHHAEGGSK